MTPETKLSKLFREFAKLLSDDTEGENSVELDLGHLSDTPRDVPDLSTAEPPQPNTSNDKSSQS